MLSYILFCTYLILHAAHVGVGNILPKAKPKSSGEPTDGGVKIETLAPQKERNEAMQVSIRLVMSRKIKTGRPITGRLLSM